MNHQSLALFALEGSRPFGERIARHLAIPLAPHEERSFEDGEHKARPLAERARCDVYVVHSLHGDDGPSANDKLCRFLFFCGALRDAGAASVTAVTPYLCYARKDRAPSPRSHHDTLRGRPVRGRWHRPSRAVDVHNVAAFENAFASRPARRGAPILVDYFAPRLLDRRAGRSFRQMPAARSAPSASGEALASADWSPRGLCAHGEAPQRGSGERSTFVGDVAGTSAIIVDDLIARRNDPSARGRGVPRAGRPRSPRGGDSRPIRPRRQPSAPKPGARQHRDHEHRAGFPSFEGECRKSHRAGCERGRRRGDQGLSSRVLTGANRRGAAKVSSRLNGRRMGAIMLARSWNKRSACHKDAEERSTAR